MGCALASPRPAGLQCLWQLRPLWILQLHVCPSEWESPINCVHLQAQLRQGGSTICSSLHTQALFQLSCTSRSAKFSGFVSTRQPSLSTTHHPYITIPGTNDQREQDKGSFLKETHTLSLCPPFTALCPYMVACWRCRSKITQYEEGTFQTLTAYLPEKSRFKSKKKSYLGFSLFNM